MAIVLYYYYYYSIILPNLDQDIPLPVLSSLQIPLLPITVVHTVGIDETIKSCLTPITEGLCRAFKVRVEQVLVSELTAVTLYKLENLVQFYLQTVW